MLCTNACQIDYDSKFDVMSYIIGDTSNSYGDEDIDNIVVLKDMCTDEITGYTVMNFGRICREHTAPYNELQKIFDVSKVMAYCGLA